MRFEVEGTQMTPEQIEQLQETLDALGAELIDDPSGDYDALYEISKAAHARGLIEGFITQTRIFPLGASDDVELEALAYYTIRSNR